MPGRLSPIGQMPMNSYWLERWLVGVHMSSHPVQGTSDPAASRTGQCNQACLREGGACWAQGRDKPVGLPQ